MKTVRNLLCSIVVATVGAVTFAPGQALAKEPPAAEAPDIIVVRQPMVRKGVDHDVAKAHGFEVRVGADGIEYPVKKGAITPRDTRTGPCGTSFVYFTAVDTRKHYTSIYTGFDLKAGMRGAITVDWVVHVVDDYGVSNKEWHTTEASVHSWHKTKGFTASGPTDVWGQVTTGLVVLWDGTICYSYGPTASARL